MEYDEILKILAPCGLNCSKCMACADGDIKKHSEELKRLLGSFDSYAERFSNFIPVFKNYPSFKELLDYFAQAECKGCRQGDGKYPDCGVAQCYKDKNVDEYYSELMDTSWTSEDSLINRPQYQTRAGRVVYGGGGVTPDVIIKMATTTNVKVSLRDFRLSRTSRRIIVRSIL